jgi:hypothetical protein
VSSTAGTWRNGAALRSSAVRRAYAAPAALGLLMVVAFVLLFRKGLGTTFFYDEWNFVLNRRGWDPHSLLRPHNEHLSLLPVLIYKLLFVTVGLSHYWVYRVVLLLAHLLCVGLLFALLRRRIGDGFALLASVGILFFGAAWQDLVEPFQVSFLGSIAAGLAMFLFLDRHDPRGDVLATIALAVSISSSGLGISFAVAAAVEVLWAADRGRRWWVPVIPLVLYGLWYLGWGKSGFHSGNITATPEYVANAASGVVGSFLGLSLDYGRPLLIVLVLLVIWAIAFRPVPSPRFFAGLAGGLSFWTLTALSRAQLHDPTGSRYLYPGAVFVLVALSGLAPTLRVRWGWLVVGWVVVAAAIVSNWAPLRDNAATVQDWGHIVQAELGAAEIVGKDKIAPAYHLDPARAPDIYVGKYFAAIADYHSSPAWTPAEIARSAPQYRAVADAELNILYNWALKPAPGGKSSSTGALTGYTTQSVAGSVRGPCVRFTPNAPNPAIELPVPAHGLLFRTADSGGAQLFLRRFADNIGSAPYATLRPGSQSLLRLPADGAPQPWLLHVVPQGPLQICAA